MNAMLESLFAWLLDFGGLATALLVAALVLRFFVRDPASRVALAWGTWLAIVAGSVLVALPSWPRIDVARWFTAPVQATPVVQRDAAAATQYVYLSEGPDEPLVLPAASTVPAVAAPALSLAAIGARVWLVIAALACCWLAMGLVRAWRLIARSQVAPQWTQEELRQIVGLRQRRLPGLLTSKQIATALALGTWQPRIVLPLASANEGNAPAVRAALAHEWAHIAAGDLWLLALERGLLPLLVLHPLFWWLRRLTRLDQELAADAAAAGDKPAEYAEALLVWAKGEPHRRAGVAALAMWERPSNLSRRIQMILDPQRNPSARRGRVSAYAVLALLFTLALGLSIVSWRPMVAQDDPAAESADSPASGEIRVYPLIGPARLTRTLPAPPAEQPLIMVELQLLSLDPVTGADALTIIQTAQRDRAPADNPEGGLAWAELNLQDSQQLVETLKSVRGTTVTAHPRLTTQNGQEATIVIGGEIPIVAVDETVNGEHRERRVEFKHFGTKFRVKPQILTEDPRMVVLEIAGEHTALNQDEMKPADPATPPLLKSQKIELAATIELGKSLVLLAAAPEMRVVKDGADIKDPENKRLLILLRPSLVEHKYVEVYPDPAAGARATATRTRYTQLAAGDGDEAKLAEQLRSIRQAVEELAREREASRQENAALRAELEQLKRSQRPAASQELRGDVQYFRAVLQPGPRVTQVYEFASAGEAKEASDFVAARDQLKKLGASLVVSNNTVTIIGHGAAIKELGPILAAKAKLIGESVNGPGPAQPQPATALALPVPMGQPAAHVVADPIAPYSTVVQAIEWLRAHQPGGEVTVKSAANVPTDRERRTHRKLLELDLQAAELEYQAAQEDYAAAQKLNEQKAISAEELRGKRRLVERTKIQLAKLMVMLEAEEEQPPAAPVPASRQ